MNVIARWKNTGDSVFTSTGRIGSVDVELYRRGMAERSDYRKAAGGPRFVLDVTPIEAEKIEALLAPYRSLRL